jgi:exonuclease III
MRIALLRLSPDRAEATSFALIARNARQGQKPSDHAPVFVDVELPVAAGGHG